MTTQLVDAQARGSEASGPGTAGEVLDAVRGLAPTIEARASEVEAARRVPPDLLDQLVGAGCFRMLLPESHGGLNATFAEALKEFGLLAEADASVAWIVMIGSGSWCDLAGLPRATFDEMYPPGRDRILAGAFNPSGSIVADERGYRVNGRWAFASGCEHADWLFGNCLAGIDNGVPELRVAVFRPEQVEIEDTWRVSGLRGTGSHHFRVADVTVPEEWTLVPLAGEPCVDSPYVRVPPLALYSLAMAGVAVGIARGALADLVALAGDKVPMLAAGTLATNPLFQFDLAGADAAVRAARAVLDEAATELWDLGTVGREMTSEERARARATAVWVTDQAAAVTRTAYRAGGGTSLYDDCPLQRRLRDIDALTQHFLVKRDTMITAGALLAGQPLTVPVF